MGPQAFPESGCSTNVDEYGHITLVRVHELLKLGYEGLDRDSCRTAEETDISGDLADSIEDVLDDGSQDWMDLFSVHNEAPVHAAKRKGKRRRRVDIRIDSALRRPRTRFAFEAKRLGPRHDVGEYLGKDGLGRFLRGEYARTEDTAGMLGYVQSEKPKDWAERIRRTLAESPADYAIVPERNWRRANLVEGLEHTYCSSHSRQTVNSPIDIYHTLLDFSQSASAKTKGD